MTTVPLRIEGDGFVLRPWQAEDLESLVLHANDESISRTISDRFPFPYTTADAEMFLREPGKPPAIVLAIEIEGVAVGGIDVRPGAAELRIGADTNLIPASAIGHCGDGLIASFGEGKLPGLGILRGCEETAIDQPGHFAIRAKCAQSDRGRFVAVGCACDAGVVGDAVDAQGLV